MILIEYPTGLSTQQKGRSKTGRGYFESAEARVLVQTAPKCGALAKETTQNAGPTDKPTDGQTR